MVDMNWLLGFIEGEGRFMVAFCKKPNGEYQIRPMFAIKLTASEKPVLEEIQHSLGGIGNIHFESNRGNRKHGMKNANDSFAFIVTDFNDVKKIRNLLTPLFFISAAKREDFDKWSKCIDLIEKGAHKTKKGALDIAKIRESMHKRKQWNKQSYCTIRKTISPCKPFIDAGKIPSNCNKCLKK